MAKEVVKKSEGVVAYDYGEQAGEGTDEVSAHELIIPLLQITQSNSPALVGKEIPGLNIGDIVNSVTKEIYVGEEGISFQPVYKEEKWVEWRLRDNGGGLVAVHEPHSDVIQKIIADNGGSRFPPEGKDGRREQFMIGDNEVIETYYIYGHILNEEGDKIKTFAVVPFSSTKIKPYKEFTSAMHYMKMENGKRPPIFAHRARIRTVLQKNDSFQFYNFAITPFNKSWGESLIEPGSDLLEEGQKSRQSIIGGQVKADLKSQTEESPDPAADGDTPF